MTALFAVTLFLAGALLFLIQPLLARMLLPLMGGAPAVWNTAMVCFQLLLLAGYLYAHASTRWLSPSRQGLVHVALLLLPVLALPIALPAHAPPPAASNPVVWVMTALLAAAGLPFLVVATTSPLLQVWFARAGHGGTGNPYALYAASNAGSMLALIGYPFLIEPRLALATQSRLWSAGYATLAILVMSCSVVQGKGRRVITGRVSESVTAGHARISVPRRRRARWVLLAFIPSSLMLSVTMHLSTNIAPIPLLWVLPLALYLATFIVAFAGRRIVDAASVSRVLPLAIVPVMVAILVDISHPVQLLVLLHLFAFTVIALASHASLAADVPPTGNLTEFYLWLSIGGALGGVFNALLAPVLFRSILEYPIVLVLSAFSLRIATDDTTDVSPAQAGQWLSRTRVVDVALPLSLVPMIFICDLVAREFGLDSASSRRIVALGAPAMICYVLAGRRLRFGLAVAALLSSSVIFERNRQLLIAERSFFGVSRVYVTGGGRYHALVHGSISHGAQSLDSARRREPLSYYTRSGPIGELVIPRQRLGLVRRVAVVGLGAGTLACYRQPGEQWTFYEIDAAVVRIAQDPRFFTYLRDCAPDGSIVLGDARRSIEAAPDRNYDLMVMDAYSADAVPMHLLTREAFALYRRKLAPGGVIALHISNQYFDLAPVVAALVTDAGMVARLRDEATLTEAESARGKTTSDWIVVAEREADLATLLSLPRWERVAPARQVWTDDFASTLSALR